ncbi:hypothetical protein, partial [Mesorhizobium sp. L2C084A000]|uniref:hypothetical protein n=1 Tax=Mesorhizobium sp. L2C084A000 TaxID=1287116 RepID=UPI001AEBC02C
VSRTSLQKRRRLTAHVFAGKLAVQFVVARPAQSPSDSSTNLGGQIDQPGRRYPGLERAAPDSRNIFRASTTFVTGRAKKSPADLL